LTALVIDARALGVNDEHVLQLVHSVDQNGQVDYHSTLRVRCLHFKNHPGFEAGLKMLTSKLRFGNPTSSTVRNQHGNGFGQVYPLGTHMHNGKYAVYARSACITREVLSGLMPCYRQVLSNTHSVRPACY
jgi:hypothetical protein